MRIIAGQLKGRALATPGKGTHDIRPTSDRAREALFSILARWPSGRFVDLFAGTGAVGLEAWSRGYGPVWAVEQPGRAQELLKANSRGTDLQILARDVKKLASDSFHDVSVVFADPPYQVSPELWSLLASRIRPWMRPDGLLVWESERRGQLAHVEGWEQVDERSYGRAHLTFFEPR